MGDRAVVDRLRGKRVTADVIGSTLGRVGPVEPEPAAAVGPEHGDDVEPGAAELAREDGCGGPAQRSFAACRG